jgi:hypothetical protein
MIFDYIIIGSGPSSVAFLSSKKLERKKVCIIDAGVEYKKNYNNHLSDRDLFNLHNTKIKGYFGQTEATNFSIKYDDVDNLSIKNSYMVGGLSNVWGAASIDYDKKTLSDIGIKHDLTSDLKFIGKLLNNREIELTSNLSAYEIYKKLSESNLTSEVYPANLAIDSKTCINCGSCLYGCAYDSIYNSKFDFKRLASSFVTYSGFLAYKILKKKQFYEILIINLKTNQEQTLKAKSIVIGSGAINSAKLLLRSFSDIEHINLLDSQCFYLPLVNLNIKKIFNRPQIQPIELSNFFIKSFISKNRIHGQFYSFGPFLKNRIKKSVNLNTNLFDSLFNVAHIYQGFLPSKYSSIGQLKKSFNNKIVFEQIKNFDLEYLNKVSEHLSLFFKDAGLISIPFAKKVEPIFSAYHFGAMKIDMNGELLTPNSEDGTFSLFDNIHLIDSSVLKNIPSGPFTSLIMANARFIANNII